MNKLAKFVADARHLGLVSTSPLGIDDMVAVTVHRPWAVLRIWPDGVATGIVHGKPVRIRSIEKMRRVLGLDKEIA